MKTKVNQILMLLSLVLAVSVRSAVPEVASNPICPAPGTLTLNVEPLEQNLEYDRLGFKWIQELDDSIGIFITDGSQNEPYKMKLFNFNFTETLVVECLGTEGFEFVGLVRHFLILQDPANSKYYLCAYLADSTDDLNIVQLALPSSTRISNPNRFKPFYYGQKLMVAVGNDDETSIQEYTVPDSIDESAPAISPTSYLNKIPQALDDFVGTRFFIYEKLTNYIAYFSFSQNLWLSLPTNPIPVGFNWEVFTFLSNRVIIMEMTNGMSSGKITNTVLYFSSLSQDAVLPQQTSSYVYQTDGIQNFVIYAGDVFYWFNVQTNGNPRSQLYNNGEINTDGIESIALSGNKLTILYDGEISYYRIVGLTTYSNQPTGASIEHIMTKTFTESIEEDGTYRFDLDCLCKGVSKFACYSSTLNCLIIKKADVECGTRDIPTPTPPASD